MISDRVMPLELRPFDYNVMLYSAKAWQQKYSVTLYSTTPWQQITLLGVMLFILYIKIKKKNLDVRLHYWAVAVKISNPIFVLSS